MTATALALCLHCATPLAPRQIADGTAYCCAGCARVHGFLVGHSLDEYYARLARLGARAATVGDDTPHDLSWFDDEAVRERLVRPDGRFAFFVPSLQCAACLWVIEKSLHAAGGVREVHINLPEKSVTVRLDEGASLVTVARALRDLGHEPFPPSFAGHAGFAGAWKRARMRELGLSGVLFVNVMTLAAALYIGERQGMPESWAGLFRWLSLALALPCLLFPGRVYFENAWRALRARKMHYDLPIAFALALAFGVSVVSVARGTGPVYFDSVVGLVFLLGAGRYVNERVLRQARDLAHRSTSLLPERALAVRVGEVVDVALGETFPADGVVVAGATEVNEAALTGESAPVPKSVGDRVLAGTGNLLRPVSMLVEKARADTFLASVERLVRDASGGKTSVDTLAARVLPVFVVVVTLVAAVAGAYWGWKDAPRALPVVLSVFIVGCPCALALAAPLSIALSLRRAWRSGVIVKSPEVFERLCGVDTIVCDKTGTLTRGRPRIVSRRPLLSHDTFRWRIGALARRSRHPLAKAVAEDPAFAGPVGEPDSAFVETEEIPGVGMRAVDKEGREFWMGAPAAVAARASLAPAVLRLADTLDGEAGSGSALLCTDGSSAEALWLEDETRPEAAAAVADWRRRGLRVVVLSGDSRPAVEKVAGALGIPARDRLWRRTPQGKLAHLDGLQAAGARVLMLGDGVNDAAALARAHVGLAVKGGVDVALASADACLWKDGLAGVDPLLAFARRARTTIAIVLGMSAAYNAIAIGFALAGFVHPLVAALIMPASSITAFAVAAWRNREGAWTSL